MKIFTGIDIVENDRIKRAIDRYGDAFLRRVFTDKEIDYCLSKKDFISCFSARFAAKEATIKAYYQAFGKTLSFKDIEVLGKKNKPAEILLHYYKNHLNINISLSISHEKNYSVAIVILYTA